MSFDNALEVSNVFLKDENLIDTSEFLNVELTKQEDVPLTVDENHLNLVENLDLNYNLAKSRIETNFNYLLTYLNNRKIHLLNKLERIYELKTLNLKLNKTENELIGFIVDEDEDSESAVNDNDNETICNNFNNSNILKQISNLIVKFGKIISTDAVEKNCLTTGEGLLQCFMNEEASFTLSCRDVNGNLTETHSSHVNANITSDEDTINCDLQYLATGLFLVKYKIKKEGTYLLNVFLNKKHVHNSPFKITCLNSRLTKLSKQNLSLSNMNIANIFGNNSNDSINSNSNSNVQRKGSIKSTNGKEMIKSTSFTQSSANGVSKLKLSGAMSRIHSSFSATVPSPRSTTSNSIVNSARASIVSTPISWNIKSNNLDSSKQGDSGIEVKSIKNDSKLKDDLSLIIGRKGRGKAEFLNPQSVCTADDLIYVTDSNNQRVNVFTIDGTFKFCFGNQTNSGNTVVALRRPIGITTIISENKILVCDYEQKCVSIYDLNGKYQSKFGLNKLIGPKGVCVNKAINNEIIVADCKGNAIYIFSLNGKFLKRFGNQSNKNENFAAPHYLSCLSNGSIVISDFYNHCIKVFSHDGCFQFMFGIYSLTKPD